MIQKKYLLVLGLFLLPMNYAFGEIIHDDLGIVNDLLISDNNDIYFFEPDKSIKSTTWIHDTKIYHSNGVTKNLVSDDYFIFPTELNEIGEYLVFATLSDECLEDTMCDFQDIVKMSKNDGSYEKIIHDLKSAVHISILNDVIFVSESNGKIWKFDKEGQKEVLLYEGSNIIMDMTSNEKGIYWIEEISDLDSKILHRANNGKIKTISENLDIPYDISTSQDMVFWAEIKVAPKDDMIKEFTQFTIFDGEKISVLEKYDNKTPLSSTNIVYGPYRFLGDYLFLTENTMDSSIIHLVDYKTNQKYDLKTISDYDVKYFRNNENTLYIIGQDENGFLIEKLTLPVQVPEFSSILAYTAIAMGLSLTIVSRKIFHY